MQSRHSRKKDSGESNEGGGGGFFMSLKATNSIQVVSLGDLFTCTQHWGIYVPV